MKSFTQHLNEAKGMLDISIKHANKHLTNDKKIEEFLTSEVEISQKTDGIKITVLRNDKKWVPEWTENWIVAYKNEIIYDGEFQFAKKSDIKSKSIGNSQFQFVLDHLKRVHKNTKSIKPGTEFFVEYLMSKPTLSSNYKQKHGMVLIATSKSSFKEKNGRLFTNPSGFDQSQIDSYAKLLQLDTPAVLFRGILGSESQFKSGIVSQELNKLFIAKNPYIDWEDKQALVGHISDLLLEVESAYGGVEEGVVLSYNGIKIKFQQSYQTDQEARNIIKMKFKEDSPEVENEYWDKVRLNALNILEKMDLTNRDLKDILLEASKRLSKIKLSFTHSKKNDFQIIEDIYGNIKMIASKRLTGNNGCLIIGKFRVLSKAHYKMIEDALKEFDSVNVALVTSKDTKDTKELRREMLEASFSNINIAETTSGNIFTLMNKFQDNINVIIAGTDRVKGYETQIKRNPDLKIKEIKRHDSDISATKIIGKISDEEYFQNNVPKELHGMYNKIKETYEDV